MRALLLLIMLGALATPAQAQSRQVIGYAGVLGEWELTATVTENSSRRSKEFSGPLTMKHTGVCTQDGPEEKTGELLYRGIAARNFERSFQLADHVEVIGASLENGLLHVELVREIPEAMKPRAIPIMSFHKVLEVKPTKLAA